MELVLEWPKGKIPTPTLQVRLLSQEQAPITGVIQDSTCHLGPLTTGTWFLDLHYTQGEESFDSGYFAIDIPDISYIRLAPEGVGARIEQMGFFDEQGEFVDMLVYQDQRPLLTFSNSTYPSLAPVTQWLYHARPHLNAQDARQQLDGHIGDLSGFYPTLTILGSWQLKQLINPELLAHTTAAWKACLMQVLRNHLLLMDHEGLYEILSEAAELAQQTEAMETLLALMEWDHDQHTWVDYPAFIQALSGQRLAK